MRKLSRNRLSRIIRESIDQVLNEMEPFEYTINDYRDLGTTSGVRGFEMVQSMYNQIERCLSLSEDDWEFLHNTNWGAFFARLQRIPEKVRFESSKNDSIDPDVYAKIVEFADDIKAIPPVDLWTSSNSGFSEKVADIKEALEVARDIYEEFIEFLLSRHNDSTMKQQDMDADWAKFDSTSRSNFDNARTELNRDHAMRDARNSGFSRNQGNAMRRHDIVMNPNNERNQARHEYLTGQW